MATKYSNVLKKNNVFLAGDAAHSLTPAGGFGLNTGIGDVHNLCWKFHFPQLLNSYSEERIPRIQEIIKSSIINYDLTLKIANNFGLNLSYAKTYQKIAENIPFGSNLFKFGMKIGQKYLINDRKAKSYLSKENNLLHLFYPKEDLEFKYSTGFFDKGGELASNEKVFYEENQHCLRLLPGVLSGKTGKPVFVRVIGKKEPPVVSFPYVDVLSVDDNSYVIRPDGHVFWSNKD